MEVVDRRFGLDQADLVIVALEGSRDAAGYNVTRLMPVCHSRPAADPAVDEVLALTLDDGSALKVAPGQTDVELPRIDADVRISA